MGKMRVVIAEPGQPARVAEIGSGLKAMQEVVGGYIEVVCVDDLDVWCNEEGLLMELPFNRMIGGNGLVGTIFVASHNEEGDTVGLTDEQVRRALLLINTASRVPVVEVPEFFSRNNKKGRN